MSNPLIPAAAERVLQEHFEINTFAVDFGSYRWAQMADPRDDYAAVLDAMCDEEAAAEACHTERVVVRDTYRVHGHEITTTRTVIRTVRPS